MEQKMKQKLPRLLAALLVGILTITNIGVVPAAAEEVSTPPALVKEDFNEMSGLVRNDFFQWKSSGTAPSIDVEGDNKYVSYSDSTKDRYLRVLKGINGEDFTQKPIWITMGVRVGETAHKKVLFQMTNTDSKNIQFFTVESGAVKVGETTYCTLSTEKWQTIVCKIVPPVGEKAGTYGTYIIGEDGKPTLCGEEETPLDDYDTSAFKWLEVRIGTTGDGILQLDNIAIYQSDEYVDLFAEADEPTTVEVTGITLDKTELALKVGAEETLSATITPDNATDKTVTWTSTDDTVATVDGAGKVTAIAVGSATITATTTNGKSATCAVTVTAAASVSGTTGTENYVTLQEAITAATAGETIKLLDDVTYEGDLTITKDVTLDLNGNTLTASSAVSFGGNVVDKTQEKTGVLKVDSTKCAFSTTNSQMPVYDTQKGGYVFADITNQEKESLVGEGESTAFNLFFKPSFGTTINTLLAGGGEAAHVNVIIRLTYNSESHDLIYNNEMIKAVYGNSNKAFYINASGVTKFEGLTITPMVISDDLGVIWSGTTFSNFVTTNP